MSRLKTHKLAYTQPKDASWRSQVAKNRKNPLAIYEALRKECFPNLPASAFLSAFAYAEARAGELDLAGFADFAHREIVLMQAATAKCNDPSLGGVTCFWTSPKVSGEKPKSSPKATGTEG